MTSGTPAVVATPTDRSAGFSRLLAWIDRLPLHGWWVFGLLFVVLFLWSVVMTWVTGLAPVGAIHRFVAPGAVYGPYVLGLIAYTNLSAVRALETFWPATGWPDADRDAWRRAFTTSPSGYGLVSFVLGLLVTVGSFLSASPEALSWDDTSAAPVDRVTLFIVYLPGALLGYWGAMFSFLHTVRQLRLVARIHREALRVDPFDRGPVYAFSGLTVRAGLGYVIIGYFTLLVNGAFQQGNAAALSVLAGTFAFGLACFILPLWGIHGRLVREKELLLHDVESRLRQLAEEMYRRVDAGLFDGTKAVGDSIAGVGVLRDRIAKLPTWPWPPNVLRGFVTALLLPVLVYVASRLVGGNFGV